MTDECLDGHIGSGTDKRTPSKWSDRGKNARWDRGRATSPRLKRSPIWEQNHEFFTLFRRMGAVS